MSDFVSSCLIGSERGEGELLVVSLGESTWSVETAGISNTEEPVLDVEGDTIGDVIGPPLPFELSPSKSEKSIRGADFFSRGDLEIVEDSN